MTTNELQKQHFDIWLLFTVIVLVGCGITMVYSSSAVLALERYGDSYFFLKRMVSFSMVGFALLTTALIIDYHCYRKLVYFILLGSVGLVLTVLIPGVGKTIGGATRWIDFGVISFQPSEFAKVAMVIYLAYSLEKKAHRIRSLSIGIFPHLVAMGLISATILYQRDFGSAAIIFIMTWLMLFAAGARLRYLFGMLLVIIPIGVTLIAGTAYRKQRVLAFLNPWDDQYGSGFQMIQSFVAFTEGGWFGRGLGQGQQKLFYLPEAHTDFIFSVIGEELGLVGVMFVISLFAVFCYRGLRIALNAPDLFGRYIALGCTALISLQAILNMAVVMGLLPTKGLALPFISYGGSSLVVSLLVVGLLLNVSSYRSAD